MRNRTTVGLLSPYLAPFSAYEQAANDLNLALVVVTPQRILWGTRRVRGLVWGGTKWQERIVPLPLSMYNRFYGPEPVIVSRLEKIIGQNKIFIHLTQFDKWEAHNILAASELNPF